MQDNKEKLLKRIDKEFKRDNHLRVLKIANRILKINPNEKKAYLFKMNALLYLGEVNKSLKIFKQLLKNNADMDTINKAFIILENKDKGEEALKILQSAFNQNSENEIIINSLISALVDLNSIEAGIDFIDKFPKENPLWLDIFFIKAVLFSNNGMFEDSLEVCNEVLNNDPHHLNALSKKVFVLNCLGKHDAALEIIDYRIENNLRPKWAMVDKAIHLMNENKKSEANNILNEVLDMDPNFGYALSNKAIIAADNGLSKLALKYINKALRNSDDKTHDAFMITKSQILFNEGDIVKSINILNNIDENSNQWNVAQILLKEYLGDSEEFF
jgi:tetratricopeptide (TPR) repeat protein